MATARKRASGSGIRTYKTGVAVGSGFWIEQCADVTFSPAAGTHGVAQSVTLSCATSGVTIHYTTDGSTPTTASPTYSAPISVASSQTVRAFAVKSGCVNGDATAAAYVIVDLTAPSAPVITSPAAGTTQAATTDVVFTAEAGGTGVAYNGATPYAAVEAPAGTYTAAGVPLAMGANSLTARVTDAAGNESAASAAVSLTREAAGFSDAFNNSNLDAANWGTVINGAGTVTETTSLALTSTADAADTNLVYYKSHPALDGKVYTLRARAASGGLYGLCLWNKAGDPTAADYPTQSQRWIVYDSFPFNDQPNTAVLYQDNTDTQQVVYATAALLPNEWYDFALTMGAAGWRYRIVRVSTAAVVLDTGEIAWSATKATVEAERWLTFGDAVANTGGAAAVEFSLFSVT